MNMEAKWMEGPQCEPSNWQVMVEGPSSSRLHWRAAISWGPLRSSSHNQRLCSSGCITTAAPLQQAVAGPNMRCQEFNWTCMPHNCKVRGQAPATSWH